MKYKAIILAALFLGMMLAPAFPTVTSAPTPQPSPLVSWVITNESWFGMDWFQPADGDDITVNAGGIVHCNWNWTGADGSRDLSGVLVNQGGIFIQHNGTRIDINTATDITVNEGGQWRSIGTAVSGCIIKGEDKTSATHYIRCSSGGKIFFDYTDIDGFFYLGNAGAGTVEGHNCNIVGMGYPLLGTTSGGHYFFFTNTIINQDTAARYVMLDGSFHATYYFINCTLLTATDNKLMSGTYYGKYIFANTTYQGISIESDDTDITTTDIDIRIYEKSTVTIPGNLAGVGISLNHSELDRFGMFFDNVTYLEIPGFLSYPTTNMTGMADIYLLNKTSYWPSGTAVASRVTMWNNWSNGNDVAAGTNQQWNVTASKLDYTTNYSVVWAGTATTINLAAAGAVPAERANQTIRSYSDENTTMANLSSLYETTDTVWINGTINFTNAQTNVYVNISIHNETAWVTDIFPTATQSFSAGVMMNLTEINGGVMNWTAPVLGQHYVQITTWKSGEVETFNTTEDFLIAPVFDKYMDYQTVLQNETGFLTSYVNTSSRLQFNGTFDSDQDITAMWINSSVFNSIGVWQRTLIDNMTFNMVANVIYNITDDIMGGVDLWVNGSDYALGEYFVGTRLNKTGEFGNIQIISQFRIGIPTCNVTVRTYNETEYVNVTSRFDIGGTAWINGTIELDNTAPLVNINVTIRNPAGTVVNWTLNATWNFAANVQYNLTEISTRNINWSSATGGQFYVQVNIWIGGIMYCFNQTEDFIFRDIGSPIVIGPGGAGGILFPTFPPADASQLDQFLGQAGIYVSGNIAQLIVLSALLLIGVFLILYSRKRTRGN